MYAAFRGHEGLVRLLLQSGAEVNATDQVRGAATTILPGCTDEHGRQGSRCASPPDPYAHCYMHEMDVCMCILSKSGSTVALMAI